MVYNNGENYMRKIKYLSCLIVFFLCFILSNELFQNYLCTFTGRFYYIDIDTDKREELYDVLNEVAEKGFPKAFAVDVNIGNYKSVSVSIFSDSEQFESISEQCDIKEGIYNSFFSGSTIVIRKDFSEIIGRSDIIRFYFDASAEEIEQIYYLINRYLPTSYVHQEDKSGLEWILDCIWIIPFLFLLMLTWFSVQFDKKRNFLRISLGASKGSIILRFVVWDTLILMLIFFLLYLILKRYIYIDYHVDDLKISFAVFLIINGVLPLSILKNDYKEIIYGANLNQSLLSNCYLMKALTLIITIASISINLYLVMGSIKYLQYYPVIETCNDQYFIDFTPDYSYYKSKNGRKELGETDEITNKYDIYNLLKNKICLDYLYKDKIRYSEIYVCDDDGNKVLFTNDASMITDDKLKERIRTDYDFTVLIPEGFPQELCSEKISDKLGGRILIPEDTYSYYFDTYDFNAKVIYMNIQENGTESDYGFDIIERPAIIFCNIDGERIREIHNKFDVPAIKYFGFELCTTRFLVDENKLNEENKFVDSIATVVSEQFITIKNSLTRIMLLNTTISVVMIALEFFLTIVIIKLEYTINAKTLSVKKILGYSLLKRNSTIFGLNLFTAFIGMITNFISCLMFNISVWYMVIITTISLLIIEIFVSLWYIQKFERVNTMKILKGGSL